MSHKSCSVPGLEIMIKIWVSVWKTCFSIWISPAISGLEAESEWWSGVRVRVQTHWNRSPLKIKSPRPLRAAPDRERFLITDKQTEILGCILCVMACVSTRQAEPICRTLCATCIECPQANKQTDGRYQTYLPPFRG